MGTAAKTPETGTSSVGAEKIERAPEKLSLEELLSQYRNIFERSYQAIRSQANAREQLESLEKDIQQKKKIDKKKQQIDFEHIKREEEKRDAEIKIVALLKADTELGPLRKEILRKVYHPQNEKGQERGFERIFTMLSRHEISDIILIADLMNEEFLGEQDKMIHEWTGDVFKKELEASRDRIGKHQPSQDGVPSKQETMLNIYFSREMAKGDSQFRLLHGGDAKNLDDFVKNTKDSFGSFLDDQKLERNLFLPESIPGWYENLCSLAGIQEKLKSFELPNMWSLDVLDNPRLEKLVGNDGWRSYRPASWFFDTPYKAVVHDLEAHSDPLRYHPLANFGYNSIHFESRNFKVAGWLADHSEFIGKYFSTWAPTPGNIFNNVVGDVSHGVMSGVVDSYLAVATGLNILPYGVTFFRHWWDAMWKLIGNRDYKGAWDEIFGKGGHHGGTLRSDTLIYLTNGNAITAGLALFLMKVKGNMSPDEIWNASKDKVSEWTKNFKEYWSGDSPEKTSKAIKDVQDKAGDLWGKGEEGLVQFFLDGKEDMEDVMEWKDEKWKPFEVWGTYEAGKKDKDGKALPQSLEKDKKEKIKETIKNIRQYVACLKELEDEAKSFLKEKEVSSILRSSETNPSLGKFETFVRQYQEERKKKLAEKPDETSFHDIPFSALVEMGLMEKEKIDEKKKILPMRDRTKLGESIMKLKPLKVEKRMF